MHANVEDDDGDRHTDDLDDSFLPTVTADPELARSPPRAPATSAVAATAATNAGMAVLALVAGVLAARLLGPAGRGHLAAAQAVGLLVGAIGTLSLGEAVVYFVGRASRPPKVVLQTATLFGAASATVLVAAAVLTMPLLLAGEPAAVDAARVYVVFGLSLVLLGFPVSFVRAQQRYGLWNLLRLIVPLCWLVVLVLFTVTGSTGVAALVGAFLLLQALFIPVVWLLASGLDAGPGGVDLRLVKPMLRYGAPLCLATLPQVMNLRLDQLLIANFETADQLGRYAVSVAWASLGLPLLNAIASVLFPKLAAMELDEARATLARSSRASVALALAISGITACSAPALVPLLFGRSFAVPVALPVILAAATGFLGLNQLIEEGLRGLGETRVVLHAELAGLMVTVPLLIALLPRLSITGAALASLVGYAAVTLVLVVRARSRIHVGAVDLLVPRRADVQDLLGRARAMTTSRRRRGTSR